MIIGERNGPFKYKTDQPDPRPVVDFVNRPACGRLRLGWTIAGGWVWQEHEQNYVGYAASCRRERSRRLPGAGHPGFRRMYASLPGGAGPDDLDR